ncbi:hypothetical protein [Jannaschia formosa]|uniref:hypothetical protein n=1 Tax=Jannaschia formosa TaxID=2259592 RepID=UPI001075852F|nr:hypothetical protein [Jannaschia formosa]TFL19667.1 hypothetical protein DR046_03970 [Jannaschia formosa]
MNRLFWFGVFFSVLYLICGLWWAVSIDAFTDLRPNELGDTLAGFFGPLAVFWLILGFFQQGAELRNSVATLKLQAEELAKSVEQQKEMALVAREALEHEREALNAQRREHHHSAQPKLSVNFWPYRQDGWKAYYKLGIKNFGARISDLRINLRHPELSDKVISLAVLESGAGEDLDIGKPGGRIAENFNGVIHFRDGNGNEQQEVMEFLYDEEKRLYRVQLAKRPLERSW